jgi:hypothetical protein
MKQPLPAWTLLIPVLLFPVVWVGLLNLIARMSGWSQLAEAYRHRGRFDGFRKRVVFAQLRGGWFFGLPSEYGGLTMGSNPQGLYLAVFPLFRPGHPPLFVPWRDVTASLERRGLFTFATFAFRQGPRVRLRVWHRPARQVVDAAGTGDAKAIEPSDWRLPCDTSST